MKNVFRVAVLGLSLIGTAVPAMAHQDNETPHGLFTIVQQYNFLKKHSELYKKALNLSAQTIPKLADPIKRLKKAINVVKTDRYDRHPDIQRQLAICAFHDAQVILLAATNIRKSSTILTFGPHALTNTRLINSLKPEERKFILDTKVFESLMIDSSNALGYLERDTHDESTRKNCAHVFGTLAP